MVPPGASYNVPFGGWSNPAVKIMEPTAAPPTGELGQVTAVLWASVFSSIKWELKIVPKLRGLPEDYANKYKVLGTRPGIENISNYYHFTNDFIC